MLQTPRGWVMHLSRCDPVSDYAAIPKVINPSKEAVNVCVCTLGFLTLSLPLSLSVSLIQSLCLSLSLKYRTPRTGMWKF